MKRLLFCILWRSLYCHCDSHYDVLLFSLSLTETLYYRSLLIWSLYYISWDHTLQCNSLFSPKSLMTTLFLQEQDWELSQFLVLWICVQSQHSALPCFLFHTVSSTVPSLSESYRRVLLIETNITLYNQTFVCTWSTLPICACWTSHNNFFFFFFVRLSFNLLCGGFMLDVKAWLWEFVFIKRASQRCSVGLMSKLCAKHVFMELVLCTRALSGWNRFRSLKSSKWKFIMLHKCDN